jgi:hypothetical protein
MPIQADLDSAIDSIDVQFKRALSTHEQEFLQAYKNNMMKVQKELAFLKEKSKEANSKISNDDNIKQLQKDIKWFKGEAFSLSKIVDKQKNDLEKQRNIAREYTENIDFLQTNVKEQMKQNKLLKAALDRQKITNNNMRNFFEKNGQMDYSRKTVDEKYVLTATQKSKVTSEHYIEEESDSDLKQPSTDEFKDFPKSNPTFITGTNIAAFVAELERKELP